LRPYFSPGPSPFTSLRGARYSDPSIVNNPPNPPTTPTLPSPTSPPFSRQGCFFHAFDEKPLPPGIPRPSARSGTTSFRAFCRLFIDVSPFTLTGSPSLNEVSFPSISFAGKNVAELILLLLTVISFSSRFLCPVFSYFLFPPLLRNSFVPPSSPSAPSTS